ncbi:putative outer membrane bacterial lipocalin, blc-like [Bradyrhizobium sp. ORS 278]|uniref:lipocalin family protein n=1 Tax=Bradyrhizobium sp. (strain ORS 278) TaxID=114615 RepID=UPI0001508F40|nr:lipocalin family protein [Bradyrhizobium sp. ORS 278]CAL77088.1 putative outer membrane bacterial lipocalin, blc-like [Bradyrhizobium sp. ORS 278]
MTSKTLRAWFFSLGTFLGSMSGTGCAGERADSGFVLDLDRYSGTWFQLRDSVDDNAAEFEQREKVKDRCVGTRVTYAAQADGTIRLRNECFEGSLDGRRIVIEGSARPVNANRTEFKIRFDPLYLRPFEFDYWVVWVDPDYQMALLSSPRSRGYTILSRVPDPSPALLAMAEEVALRKGYSNSLTVETPQGPRAGGP